MNISSFVQRAWLCIGVWVVCSMPLGPGHEYGDPPVGLQCICIFITKKCPCPLPIIKNAPFAWYFKLHLYGLSCQ